MMHSKYLFRPFTKRMPQHILFALLERWVPHLLKLSKLLGRTPLVGRVLRRMVPVADYTNDHPLTAQQLREWALLDTFDMLAPAHDKPQTVATAYKWFVEAGFTDIEVGHWSHLGVRGIKPK